MSTSYYLVQTEPTPLYGRAKVAQSSGGVTSPWMGCSEPEWVIQRCFTNRTVKSAK